jgi:hypothetical protein
MESAVETACYAQIKHEVVSMAAELPGQAKGCWHHARAGYQYINLIAKGISQRFNFKFGSCNNEYKHIALF